MSIFARVIGKVVGFGSSHMAALNDADDATALRRQIKGAREAWEIKVEQIETALDRIGHLERDNELQDRHVGELQVELIEARENARVLANDVERFKGYHAASVETLFWVQEAFNRREIPFSSAGMDRGEVARLWVEDFRARLAKATETIAALSQPRVINVAGMVERDLAERYESLRLAFDSVQIQRDRHLDTLERERADFAKLEAERDRLRVAVQHQSEQIGKLHARLNAAEPAMTVATIEEAVREGLVPGVTGEMLDEVRGQGESG